MAGNGAAPKDPEQRRRRNVPTAGEWMVLPAEPFKGAKPNTPKGLSAHALETWRQWWSSPMAWMWSAADWPALTRLIILIDEYDEFGSLDRLKEIRLQEDRFGLSPKGRQGLRWRLPVVEALTPAAKRGGRTSSRSAMRDRLTVVGGTG